MDFLNKAYAQVAELFRSMTPAARLTTGLLLVVIVLSLVFLFRQQTNKANEYLFGARPLTNSELSDMAAAFSKAQLDDWETEGNRVRVPRGQRHKYIAALVEGQALPQDAASAWEAMFAAQSPFENRQTQQLRTRFALQQHLSYVIRELGGIDTASVTLSEIETDGFRPRRELRAAVAVKADGTQPLEANQIKMIRDTVANGGGVKPENVVITDVNGRRSYIGPKPDSVASEQHAYAEAQRRREEEIRAKILDHLSIYEGVKVAVYVKLDEKLKDELTQVKLDEKPTVLRNSNTTVESSTVKAPTAGRPGAETNALGNRSVAVDTGPQTETTRNETSEEQVSATGVTHLRTTTTGLVEKSVTVSILVPQSHFTKVWRQQNPVPPGEAPRDPTPAELQALESAEIAKIEDSILPLLPNVAAGEDKYPRVTVKSYVDLPVPAPESPSLAQTATAWFSANWQTLAALAVAGFGLFFLRGMLRSAPEAVAAPALAEGLPIQQLARQADQASEVQRTEENRVPAPAFRGRAGGRGLREELADLVREDPAAAANVLQSWISEAVH